ncbi:hypothetical protein Celaphus_00017059 [Cervus elaphus hippelaphus]|uniref:Uncharacterized protein n=1 Tax=Cervus elaphus hippelaphus TaxID=46360 RepID=A0A212CM78_CEREH|nr:hypothetical protein Celaphus_00017059 [Cervus elaphus hippelaphus]
MPPSLQPSFASSSLPGSPLPPRLQGELRVGVARAGGAASRLRSAVGWRLGRDSEKRWQCRRAVAVEPWSPALFALFASGREPALAGSLPGSAF